MFSRDHNFFLVLKMCFVWTMTGNFMFRGHLRFKVLPAYVVAKIIVLDPVQICETLTPDLLVVLTLVTRDSAVELKTQIMS